MHRVIVEPNGSDHRWHSYTIWVTKTDRLIMCSTKHIQGMTILTEQHLWEQIKMAVGWLEGVFMQAIPAEVDRLPKL